MRHEPRDGRDTGVIAKTHRAVRGVKAKGTSLCQAGSTPLLASGVLR